MRLALNLGIVEVLVGLEDIWTQCCVVCETRRIKVIVRVACNQSYNMVSQESLSPGMKVFMIEEEALWHEIECADSQQGSSSEGNLLTAVMSARALSQIGTGPSGRHIEKVDSEETEIVY